MRAYVLTHVSDADLLRDLPAVVARERGATVTVLVHIAEVDARKLYRQAGHSSMHAYCLGELHFSDDAAFTRILVARAARQFPVLFADLEQGRLHLTAVRLLAPHLTPENIDELIAASVHRRTVEVERFLAQRFPLSKATAPAPLIRAIPTQTVGLVLKQVEQQTPLLDAPAEAPKPVAGPTGPRAPAAPPPPERFLLKLAIDKETHDLLRYVQALLGHAVPTGDVAQVLHRALAAYAVQLERRKFGATKKPRARKSQRNHRKRYVPADVRRAVWGRDRGECTFVSSTGRRCGASKLLEFDHVDPVALGGRATVERVRLRCRAHNQYAAERAFGAEFVRGKRAERRSAAEASKADPGRERGPSASAESGPAP